MVGILAFSGTQLVADPDPGKNFTVSDSPNTTVFNLQVPSTNRHITDIRKNPKPAPAPAPAPVADCDTGIVTDYVDKYLVRLEKSAPDMVSLNDRYDYNYTVIAKDKVKKVVVKEQIPAGATYVSSDPEAEVSGSDVT